MPRRSAAAMILIAVVEFADSNGGSISASVSVFSSIALPSSVPDGLHPVAHEHLDEVVHARLRDARAQLVARDAALAQREVVGEDADARLREPGKVLVARPA